LHCSRIYQHLDILVLSRLTAVSSTAVYFWVAFKDFNIQVVFWFMSSPVQVFRLTLSLQVQFRYPKLLYHRHPIELWKSIHLVRVLDVIKNSSPILAIITIGAFIFYISIGGCLCKRLHLFLICMGFLNSCIAIFKFKIFSLSLFL